jgi:hypothetical protein
MGYHYSACQGYVIPFNEETAEKLGCLEAFKFLKDWQPATIEPSGLDILTTYYDSDSDNKEVQKAVDTIHEAIRKHIPGGYEIYREMSEIVEPGEVIKEDQFVIYIYFETLHEPKPLLQELQEKFNIIYDYWVTGG